MTRDDKQLEGLADGFRKRTLVTARLASRVGSRYARRVLGKASEGAEPLSEQARARALANAEALVQEMGELKGLVMKLGQMVSYLPGTVSPEAQRVLSRLQAASTAMRFDVVREVLEQELGAPPEQAFDELAPEPFAAASIGQVHRGRLGARPVAVKIQYPGIERALDSDLKTLGMLTSLSTFGSPIDGKALIQELALRMRQECDYRGEAENQRYFAQLLASQPGASVPAVVDSHSRQRVLTTELVSDARDFNHFCETASQPQKDAAAEVIFRVCFDCIFRHAVYNADPHPGNYLVREDGSVTFLDFGCICRFDPEFVASWKRLALAVTDADRAAFERLYPELGFVGKRRGFDWDYQWQMMRHLYQPFTEPGFRYSKQYVEESYGLMIFDNPNQRRMAIPPEWLLLNRLQWGLNAVLALLEASGPWPELWRAALESPPPAPHQATPTPP